jgi:polysaccharide lyase-like protein
MFRRSALAALLLCATAEAGVLWTGDFETHDLSQWDAYVVNAGDWTFVQSNPTPRQGLYAARVQLDAGDYGPSNLIRTEVGHTPASVSTFQNTERYYAWSSWLSTDFPLGAFDHQLMFWECDAPIYQQEMSLHVSGTTVTFNTSPQGGQYQTQWTGTLALGQWHDFILHVMWSLDPAVGFVELWSDGTLVVPKFFMRTMHAVKDGGVDVTPLTSTMHHGLFLGTFRPGKPVEVVYLDDVREATSLADVLPAPDAGPGDSGSPDGGAADAGASTPDSGGVDAGSAAVDSGGPGTGPSDARGSCGCAAPSSGQLLAVGALALLLLRRARSPGRPARRAAAPSHPAPWR